MTHSYSFSLLKQINQSNKDLVIGYIKNVHKDYGNNIPELVLSNILLFYFIHEKFTKCGIGGMKILNQGSVLKCTAHEDTYRAYANIKIGKKYGLRYSWTLEIDRLSIAATIVIGIVTNNDEEKPLNPYDIYPQREDQKYYAFESYYGNLCAFCHNDLPSYNTCDLGGMSGQCILKLDVNIINKALTANVDYEDKGIVFDDMAFDDNEEYVLFVSSDNSVIIKILNFELYIK